MVLQTAHAQALGEFFHAYRLGPAQPLTLLCLAVAHVQHAMTRKVNDRHRTVLQAFAFLQVSSRTAQHICSAGAKLQQLLLNAAASCRCLLCMLMLPTACKACMMDVMLCRLFSACVMQEYAQHRANSQESNYNLGRAAHHLGITHIAVQYYQKCLHIGNSSYQAEQQSPAGKASLQREAAFNLSLIYRDAGADDLARQVLRQFLTV